MREFQPLIAGSVYRVVRLYGAVSPALVDDLVQDTYLHLCQDNFRRLRDFRATDRESIFRFLKVVATNVARDHFRARATHKRRGEVQDDGTNLQASVSSSGMERSAQLAEIDRRLAATESERDCTIFGLYYRQGFTAKEIASMPGVGLNQKGVESCLYRLVGVLRAGLARTPATPEKGWLPGNTLGGVE